MGLLYHLPFPEPQAYGRKPKVQFVEWLLDLRDQVSAGTAVARIEIDGQPHEILTNGVGYFWEKLVKSGDKLSPKQNIALIATEGEDVPYGKPHSLLRRVAD